MKKMILSAAVTLVSFSASADIINCVFTEPFINTSYSSSQQTLTVRAVDEAPVVHKNVSIQFKPGHVIELVSSDGKLLQTLTETNKGSDGMSDRVYPFDVVDESLKAVSNSGMGGCTSNYLKAKEQQ